MKVSMKQIAKFGIQTGIFGVSSNRSANGATPTTQVKLKLLIFKISIGIKKPYQEHISWVKGGWRVQTRNSHICLRHLFGLAFTVT